MAVVWDKGGAAGVELSDSDSGPASASGSGSSVVVAKISSRRELLRGELVVREVLTK